MTYSVLCLTALFFVAWRSDDFASRNLLSIGGNKSGANAQIEYLDPLQRKCIGRVWPKEPLNPKWIVSYDKGKTWNGPHEAISIVDDNGTAWRTKMVINGHKGLYNYVEYTAWLENLHGAPKEFKRGTIHILDWTGKKWDMDFKCSRMGGNSSYVLTPVTK